jgi:hypothetical protein
MENNDGPVECPATRQSAWARDGKTMRCEKPAGHRGKHEALSGFIMFTWEQEVHMDQEKTVVGDYKIRELVALGRDIWGNHRYRLDEIVIRLMKGVGDLALIVREGEPRSPELRVERALEIKKELGNIIISTIRWCDDLGFDVIECVALAVEAQRKYATSGKAR